MTDLLIRNVTEKIHGALRRRAKKNGRSVNAEILAVLEQVAKPEDTASPLAILNSIKSKHLREGETFPFEVERDKSPARFLDFSGPDFDVHEV
jgi:antitoxin FitA